MCMRVCRVAEVGMEATLMGGTHLLLFLPYSRYLSVELGVSVDANV